MQAIVKAYFQQDVSYVSESKEEIKPIATMHPRHAGNAAVKLLRESQRWAEAAGLGDTGFPQIWMTTTPLFIALARRAKQASN